MSRLNEFDGFCYYFHFVAFSRKLKSARPSAELIVCSGIFVSGVYSFEQF